MTDSSVTIAALHCYSSYCRNLSSWSHSLNYLIHGRMKFVAVAKQSCTFLALTRNKHYRGFFESHRILSDALWKQKLNSLLHTAPHKIMSRKQIMLQCNFYPSNATQSYLNWSTAWFLCYSLFVTCSTVLNLLLWLQPQPRRPSGRLLLFVP